jgi:hypothetical protein
MFIDVPTCWLIHFSILLVLYMDRRAIHMQYSVYAACTARRSIRTERVLMARSEMRWEMGFSASDIASTAFSNPNFTFSPHSGLLHDPVFMKILIY